MFCWIVLFFKQKTAYDMRISDWSTDVCSSDIPQVCEFMLLTVDDAYLALSVLGRGEMVRSKFYVAVDGPMPIDKSIRGYIASASAPTGQIGRASWRERVCQYV